MDSLTSFLSCSVAEICATEGSRSYTILLQFFFVCVNFQWKIAYACVIGKLFFDIRVNKVNIFGVNFFKIV